MPKLKNGRIIPVSRDDEYYTPKSVLDYFGTFDYDPATTAAKAQEFGITNFDTIETDGLRSDWSPYKKIWINPPFTLKKEFLQKAWNTYRKTKADIYILLPVPILTNSYFSEIVFGGKIFMPDRQLNYESGLGKKRSGVTFGTFILKLQDEWEIEFVDRDKLNRLK